MVVLSRKGVFFPLPTGKGVLSLALVGALVATAALSQAAPDASADDAARRAKIAVTVGTKTVTVGELEDRLSEIPPFQAATFGASRDEIVHAFVEQIIVRDLLLGAGAEARKLDTTLPTKQELDRARSSATLRALRAEGPLKSKTNISNDDIKKYYEDNRTRFDAPERINVWRILCKSKEDAESVIALAKRDLTIAKYNELARDHSTDKATNFRGGNLGFLLPDGTSNEAGVKVDAGLFKAASTVKDGELVPSPVSEAGGFAVVWRRATVPATHRALDEVSDQIRTTLYRERTEAAEKKLIDDLRAKYVRDVNADLLKIIEIPPVDAGLGLPRSIPQAHEAGAPSKAH